MFDFRILSAEVQRWGMMEQFSASTLAYADTYFELKKVFKSKYRACDISLLSTLSPYTDEKNRPSYLQ